MHELQTIATDDTRLCWANTAEQIEVLLPVEPLGEPRNITLDGNPDFPQIRCGLHQITLATYYYSPGHQ